MLNHHQPQNSIKIVCLSDTHGLTSKVDCPQGDILIHCGDFTVRNQMEDFDDFIHFLKTVNFKYKIVISGNHELLLDTQLCEEEIRKFPNNKYCVDFYSRSDYCKSVLKENCIYLENQSVNIMGYKFYGTPLTPVYSNGSF